MELSLAKSMADGTAPTIETAPAGERAGGRIGAPAAGKRVLMLESHTSVHELERPLVHDFSPETAEVRQNARTPRATGRQTSGRVAGK